MSKKPRVLVFGKFFDPGNLGGVEAVAQTLIDLLHDDFEFVNLVPSKTAQGFAAQMPCGVPVFGTPSWNVDGSLALSPALIFKAREVFKTFQPDLIHLHFPDPVGHLASLFLPPRVPRVISWHADIVRQKKLLKIYRPFLNHALKTTRALIVATPHHKNSSFLTPKFIDPAKVLCIPYALAERFFSADSAKVAALRQKYAGKKIIFALGRHVSYKGFDVLLAALSQLPADTFLILGGQGPLTETLKEKARELGIAARVDFVGAIANKDLPAFYHACDLFCLPSVTTAEAFGLVQIEAMAAGKPVVSSKLGTGVDFVNQNNVTGFTTPPADVAALTAALKEILENEALKNKMGAAALERVKKEFSLNNMREKTKKLYLEIIAAKNT